jgi:hypothetical protein
MNEFSERTFGLIIAYLLPGFVALCGAACLSDSVNAWLVTSGDAAPSVGGFLYVAIGSLTAGMTASAIRWAFLDTYHHNTGIDSPRLDFSRLQKNLDAFTFEVESHYRYYQFYGNTLVSLVFAYITWRTSCKTLDHGLLLADIGVLVLGTVFLVASRDSLRKYYERTSQVLGVKEPGPKGDGNDERIRSHGTAHQGESINAVGREERHKGG